MRRPGRIWMSGLLATVALTAGCGLTAPASEPGGAPSPSAATTETEAPSPSASRTLTGSGLAQFYEQKVSWTECQQIFQCARILVPLDYVAPDGPTIELSLIKRPAEDPDQRVGSLLVNPGGPGGSGIEYVENATSTFGQPLLDSFDLVGFDPRGVGESTPVDCLSDDQLDAFIATDPDPDSKPEIGDVVQMLADFATGCQQLSGDLLAHVSTAEVARDIDVLRALVGDDQLNYLGASYGTYLGATYAELFPDRVGRLVLDGAVDPTASGQEMALVQAAGFQIALRAYVEDCVQQSECPLGSDVDDGLARISAFFEQVDREPISGDGERQLTEAYAVIGVWLPLYVRDYWPLLTQALEAALRGEGAQLLQLADYYTRRGATGFADNSNEVIYAVNCLDHPEGSSVKDIRASISRFERASSVFGSVFAWGSLACGRWPVTASDPVTEFDAEGAGPILVVGTTRDPATPYEWAVSLADQLESGVLLSRDGDGHTAYMAGNDCIDDTIEAYLVDGTVPPDGQEC